MKHFLLVCFFLVTTCLAAQTPTWANAIAPILYANCTSCHHAGGLAPFSLLSYNDAVGYKYQISSAVDSLRMPPWPPDPQYKHLAHERVLSASDKNKIKQWAYNGAPQGDPNSAPPIPTYTNTSTQLSSVDYSGKMANYVINTTQDLYRCFIIPTYFTTDKFAAEIEVKPGNPKVVHHVLVYEDTNTVLLNNLDAASPGIGYTSFFGTGLSGSRLAGEWVPGTAPIKFPAGMGIRLRKNTNLILQIHYPAGTSAQLDSTRVNIKFANGTVREVYLAPVLSESNITNGPFSIPPQQVKTFRQEFTNNLITMSLLSIAPHMHLIGSKYKVYAVGPQQDTIPLISIKKWNFNWQGVYAFRNPIKIPLAYKVIGETEYDNRSSNPSNPNSPPQTITYGENTTDEMMQTYMAFTIYYPGDETIVIDNSPIVGLPELGNGIVKTLQLYEPSPNPVKDKLHLSFFSVAKEKATLEISDLSGQIVLRKNLELEEGFGEETLDMITFKAGIYFVNLKTKTSRKTKKIIIE